MEQVVQRALRNNYCCLVSKVKYIETPVSTLQVLPAIEVAWNYFLPCIVFIVCYWRIMLVVRSRQCRVIHITVQTISNQNTNSSDTVNHELQVCNNNRSVSCTSQTATAAAAGAATAVSRQQLNLIQTMILVTASFIILWMPAALTVLLVYFQVGFFFS